MRVPCATLAALVLLCAGPRAEAAALQFLGRGVQIYDCTGSGTPSWTLKAPDAVLYDAAGGAIGQHFAGPSWRAKDGSTIVGQVLVSSAAPLAGAIPWLVLRVTSHGGQGLFSAVGYVTRTATQGGVAPATGCDAGHVGAELRVPYSATYIFFAPVGAMP